MVVIGGQSLSLLLTLIVTPVSYSLLDDLARSERWGRVRSRVASLRERASARFGRLFARRTT